jgi:hypothetical protein
MNIISQRERKRNWKRRKRTLLKVYLSFWLMLKQIWISEKPLSISEVETPLLIAIHLALDKMGDPICYKKFH